MQKRLRVYKSEYDTLPQKYKEFLNKTEDGQERLERGLILGRRKFLLDEIEIVEKGKTSGRSGARHIAVCKQCGKLNLMYANGLCAACYQRSNFKKNHPEIALKRELNVKERKDNAKERQRQQEIRDKCSNYPYNLLMDVFGETLFDMFGSGLDDVGDAQTSVLDTLIDRLSDKYKVSVTRYYKNKESFREIAIDLGCTGAWISDMVGRFRETVEANREAIKTGDISKLIYLRNMYKPNENDKRRMVTWATIRLMISAFGETDDTDSINDDSTDDSKSLKELFSHRTYRYLRKAGIYSLEDLQKSLENNDNTLQRVKGVGLDVMTEIFNVVYSER